MNRSLRRVLADSHVAAVTITILLLWSLDAAFRALWEPAYRVLHYVVTAVLILDIPAFSPTNIDRMMLTISAAYLYWAIIDFAAAWLLARYVYGTGPLLALSNHYKSLIVRNDA